VRHSFIGDPVYFFRQEFQAIKIITKKELKI
jgi:hypothetical protein